jgi:hypothetical protein
MNTANVEIDRSLTIAEFCALERISKAAYYGLRGRGLGPEEFRPPGTSIVRITAQARREWHARIGEAQKSQAAELEVARRSAQAAEAGRIAAQSPAHVSKRDAGSRRHRRRGL